MRIGTPYSLVRALSERAAPRITAAMASSRASASRAVAVVGRGRRTLSAAPGYGPAVAFVEAKKTFCG
jgi:hypothetical protein